MPYAKTHYYRRDNRLFEEYKAVLSAEKMPSTLAEFQQMEYNEGRRFDLLRQYKESVEKGKVNNIGFYKFEAVLKEANEKIIGITTSTGVRVEGISYHLIERIICSDKEKRLGVSVDRIVETLINGACDNKIKVNDKGQRGVGFIGEGVFVSFNIDTKTVIQCRPMSRKK